jgi:hypothetical protein
MARPNPERQIHRACGDVRVALLGALELLSESTVSGVGCDDMFRAFSDLGRVQQHVAVALHAANLLDQMVGIPVEQRPPWSYYRSRIGKKLGPGLEAPLDDCYTLRIGGSLIGDAARRSVAGTPQTDSSRASQPLFVLDVAGGERGFAGR